MILAIIAASRAHSGAEAAINGAKTGAFGYLVGYLSGWFISPREDRTDRSPDDTAELTEQTELSNAIFGHRHATDESNEDMESMDQEGRGILNGDDDARVPPPH